MHNAPVSSVIFLLFCIGIIWLLLTSLLLNRLEKNHPDQFVAMGRPKLSRYGVNGALLGFLITRGHRRLNDSYLSILSDGDLVVLICSLLVVFYDIFFGLPR
jgi:hypothetical protein